MSKDIVEQIIGAAENSKAAAVVTPVDYIHSPLHDGDADTIHKRIIFGYACFDTYYKKLEKYAALGDKELELGIVTNFGAVMKKHIDNDSAAGINIPSILGKMVIYSAEIDEQQKEYVKQINPSIETNFLQFIPDKHAAAVGIRDSALYVVSCQSLTDGLLMRNMCDGDSGLLLGLNYVESMKQIGVTPRNIWESIKTIRDAVKSVELPAELRTYIENYTFSNSVAYANKIAYQSLPGEQKTTVGAVLLSAIVTAIKHDAVKEKVVGKISSKYDDEIIRVVIRNHLN